MRYTIEINCDGAAFEEDPSGEIQTILANLRNRISRNGVEDEAPLFDRNGNTVGKAVLEGGNETYREIPTLDPEDV